MRKVVRVIGPGRSKEGRSAWLLCRVSVFLGTEDMSDHYDDMLRKLKAGVAGYERSLAAIDAHVAMLRKVNTLFSVSPPLPSGEPALMPCGTGNRCKRAVLTELRKCRKEIAAHIERVRELRRPEGEASLLNQNQGGV